MFIKFLKPAKKRRVLIVFDDTIADKESNKKLGPLLNELFLRRRQLNILLVFISQSYFKVPKTIRLNATYLFFQKFLRKERVAPIHSSHNDLRDYTKELYKD